MKILNLLKIMSLMIILTIIIIYAFIFFTQIIFVKNIDGNEINKMIKIRDNYYFNDLDSSTWLFEDNLGTYKRMTNNGVDTLTWDNNIIIGHSKLSYFKILLNSKKTNYYKNKTNLLEEKYYFPKYKLKKLPPLIGKSRSLN